jgi:hypothetical protein
MKVHSSACSPYCPCHANGLFFHSECMQSVLPIIRGNLLASFIDNSRSVFNIVPSKINGAEHRNYHFFCRSCTSSQGRWSHSFASTHQQHHRQLHVQVCDSCGTFLIGSKAKLTDGIGLAYEVWSYGLTPVKIIMYKDLDISSSAKMFVPRRLAWKDESSLRTIGSGLFPGCT